MKAKAKKHYCTWCGKLRPRELLMKDPQYATWICRARIACNKRVEG
jgi:hypothetical protein